MSRRTRQIEHYLEIGRYVYHMYQKSAMYAVKKAKADGRLKPPCEHRCADCEKTAAVYDHRDYSKPVDVVAVCDGCNGRRGPGLLSLDRIRRDLGPYWEGDDVYAYSRNMGEELADDEEIDETHWSPS